MASRIETRPRRRPRHDGTEPCAGVRANPGIHDCRPVCSAASRRSRCPGSFAARRPSRPSRRRSPTLKPDVVSINTLPDTHAVYAIRAMQAGAHVFVEKPIAEDRRGRAARRRHCRAAGRKLVVGYILRHHPSWIRFIEMRAARSGTPLRLPHEPEPAVERPAAWACTSASHRSPVRRSSTAASTTWTCVPDDHGKGDDGARRRRPADRRQRARTYNYGHAAGDVRRRARSGGMRPGWGPMMSETAFFVKDVIGPKGRSRS